MAEAVQSHRRVSALIFKHVLREFVVPLICALAAFAFLFMVNNVFDDLPDFMSKDVPWHVVVSYFLALQPHNLLNVIPISVLLAASFMTVMMGRNNELCAMRAAGMSLFTCALPVWLIALLACFCVIGIGESWGPAGVQKANDIRRHWLDSKKKTAEPIAFSNSQARRDWYCTEIDEEGILRNVILRQFDEQGESQWMIVAESAEFTEQGCRFRNGSIQKQTAVEGGLVAAPATFKEYDLECTERSRDIIQQGLFQDGMTTRAAWGILHSEIPPSGHLAKQLKTVIWNNVTFPLASLVAAFFGVALTIANQRSEIMKGFAGAIGALVLFYLVGQIMLVLGKNGWLPPFVGGALPSLAFTAAGFWTMWRRQ